MILFARDSYYDATGAPAWSGGQYDSFDGRIRIPIGGLSASLTPDIDETLVHELTHAFVADLSRGAAPRELHEGLAQYMEGKRMSQLDSERLRALADGRLARRERLLLRRAVARRVPAGAARPGRDQRPAARDGDERSVDEAFRTVYGQDFAGTPAAGAAEATTATRSPSGRQLERQPGDRAAAGERAAPAQERPRFQPEGAQVHVLVLPLQERLPEALALGQHHELHVLARRDARALASQLDRLLEPAQAVHQAGRRASWPVQTRPCATASISACVFLRPSAALLHEVLVEGLVQRADLRALLGRPGPYSRRAPRAARASGSPC